MNSKINIYIGANAANTLRQAGMTLALSEVRGIAYSEALGVGSPIAVYGEKESLIKGGFVNDGKGCVNNVMLRIDKDIFIEFIDAKVSVTKKNRIHETQLVNRVGTVKEFIQEEDYDVRISGNLHFVVDKNNPVPLFPHDKLVLLNKILSISESIEVAGVYFDIFGIKKIAMTSAVFDQAGMRYFNIMPFTLSFKSDMDYDFLLIDS